VFENEAIPTQIYRTPLAFNRKKKNNIKNIYSSNSDVKDLIKLIIKKIKHREKN